MNRDAFLVSLRSSLAGMPPGEVAEIAADYAAHFDEAQASGRSEEEVAKALGDPARLGRELRAEAGLRRWEHDRGPGGVVAALLALTGLAAFDIVLLLPILIVFCAVMLAIGIAAMALGVVSVGLLLSVVPFWHFTSWTMAFARLLLAVGLAAASIGLGSLLLLALNVGVKVLGDYARLHYRLVKPPRN
ncbi:DUF1700 domain-containing protein [Mesorhizobium sp. B2-3-4]|uniref:DUF1700 domain-containing protein n=1 Tax=Mesorhizobium sp. B2-3-4 TaxID=2589959 RepID=UPI00112CE2D6|nr:DUF1700 domain-containing protein [Mesorhizobium sp. B2-3-4]TPM38668.1 DUF1700 domain-containing protein [Mesorhizobium sp. B2-3-4]